MLTFVAPCRPFTGIFDRIQRTAIASWRNVAIENRIVLLGPDLPDDTDADQTLEPATNDLGTTTLTGIWEIALAQQTDWLCVVESDIILSTGITNVLDNLSAVARPFVIGQRWDVEPGNAEPSQLHPPSAISYCLLRGGTTTTDGMPPFAIGRTAHDNWLVWAAIHRWNMTVIDATEDIYALHLNHPYVEYGDKATMQSSEERRENLRMAAESGMPRPYGVNDAPYVLRHAKLMKRSDLTIRASVLQ